MEKKGILLLLDEVMELDAGTLTGQEALDAMDAWDSIAVMSLIAMADEKFGRILQASRISECQTVGDVVSLLEGPAA